MSKSTSPRRRWLLLLGAAALATGGGCAKAAPEAIDSVEVFLPVDASSEVAVQRAPARPDPHALAELLDAAPPPMAERGALVGPRLVGSDTGVKVAASASAEPRVRELPPAARVSVRVPWSSPALERASRAQLYWAFGRSCRLPDGALPPPDSIKLLFDIQPDGSVLPSSVSASADGPALGKVAECVERVFLASGFAGPIEGRGSNTTVLVTWPSVD